MKKILINLFIFFVLFSDIIFNKFNLPNIFQTWDVVLEITLLLVIIPITIRKIIDGKKISKKFLKCYVIMFLLIIDGLIGNFLYSYASSYIAILKDILSWIYLYIKI